jgi:membrane-associated phospholipid phosphatase
LPIIRAETPPLARIQSLTRSPILDSYFAFTANLGTHTFFMIFIPLIYWCGREEWGHALVNMLAAGVVLSGIIKDLLCLPRPVSPPLQRITMSGSAALEYGFLSTHSTNALSVALYAIWSLPDPELGLSETAKSIWTVCFCIYVLSIALGRLYCGMHGFSDVIAGGALGALLTLLQFEFGERYYEWVLYGSFWVPFLLMVAFLFVVRTHPEPADNCPCFDDSVAFLGVVIGINWSIWNRNQFHAVRELLLFLPDRGANPAIGVPLDSWKNLIRVPVGVAIIVAYRAFTKPLMFRVLPPLFRVLEHLDLDLPRRYFLKASEYNSVPKLRRDDNVLPSPSDMGQMIGDVRKRRGRAISVGPQSAADAYEVIAYRKEEKRRRGSSVGRDESIDSLRRQLSTQETNPDQTRMDKLSPEGNKDGATAVIDAKEPEMTEKEVEIEERRVIFSGLPMIRMRYDVEVITKLIIYAGIGWWAVEGCPVVFEVLGLGP